MNAVEDLSLSVVYGGNPVVNAAELKERMPSLESRLFDLSVQLLARQSVKPHAVLIGAYGSREVLLPLMSAYYSIARAFGYQIEARWYEIHSREQFRRNRVLEPGRLFESPPVTLSGIAMEIDGPYASLRFAREGGMHALSRDGRRRCCRVEASEKPLADFVPPEPDTWPKDNAIDPRRTYDLDQNVAWDQVLRTELRWSGRSIEPVIADAIGLQLRKAARAVIET